MPRPSLTELLRVLYTSALSDLFGAVHVHGTSTPLCMSARVHASERASVLKRGCCQAAPHEGRCKRQLRRGWASNTTQCDLPRREAYLSELIPRTSHARKPAMIHPHIHASRTSKRKHHKKALIYLDKPTQPKPTPPPTSPHLLPHLHRPDASPTHCPDRAANAASKTPRPAY